MMSNDHCLIQPCYLILSPLVIANSKEKKCYSELGITSYLDLLLYLPKAYKNFNASNSIISVHHGQDRLCVGSIISIVLTGRYKKHLQVTLEDDTSILQLLFFHKIPYYHKTFIKYQEENQRLKIYGTVKVANNGVKTMIHPQIIKNTMSGSSAVVDDNKDHKIGGEQEIYDEYMTPIYKTVKGLSEESIHRLVMKVLYDSEFQSMRDELLKEALPLPEMLTDSVGRNSIMSLLDSLRILHNLTVKDYKLGLHHKAILRIKLDELIVYQLLMMQAHQNKASCVIATQTLQNDIDTLTTKLPYQLTKGQLVALQEIMYDLQQHNQMNRLLQGDVGCGKTIVSFLVAIIAIQHGAQVCIMAPTQLLATQHYHNFMSLFADLTEIISATVLITGKKSKQDLSMVENGDAKLIIGTHALIYEKVQFNNLGLVIIDEQHRFGVKQRYSLLEKGKNSSNYPHLLMMSATPIPRSQALHLYADLQFSTINQMPVGRKTTNTVLMNNKRKHELAKFALHHIKLGTQVYWVCPLIEKSDSETMENISDLQTINEWMQEHLTSVRISVLHGEMKADQKDEIMQDFIDKKFDILLTTTVIETGVDVKNANILVLEHADRFGLASIHQLRGRVGRGQDQGHCVLLFQEDISHTAKQRLNILRNTTDGFEIAEQDLQMRGYGELIGERQSGCINFKYASIPQDHHLLSSARKIAQELLCTRPDIVHWYVHTLANLQY